MKIRSRPAQRRLHPRRPPAHRAAPFRRSRRGAPAAQVRCDAARACAWLSCYGEQHAHVAHCSLSATPRACADAAPAWRAAERGWSARAREVRRARRLRAEGCAARRSTYREARASSHARMAMLLHQLPSPAAASGAWPGRGHGAALHLGECTAQTACVRLWDTGACARGSLRVRAMATRRQLTPRPQATHVQHAHARCDTRPRTRLGRGAGEQAHAGNSA